MSFEQLPEDVILHIFRLLDYKDLLSLSMVNCTFSRMASMDTLWKHHCKVSWLLDRKEENSWKDTFAKYFREYGRYIDIYSKIKGAWNKFESFMRVHSPAMYESLQGGLSEEELDSLTHKYKVTLPDTLRLFYRLHGGQNYENNDVPTLFGTFDHFSNANTNLKLIFVNPLHRGLTAWNGERKITGEAGEVSYYTLPICQNHPEMQLCIVLPKEKPSQDLPDHLRPHCIAVVSKTPALSFGRKQEFLSSSLEDWFLQHVDRTVTGCYRIQDGNLLRYYYDPNCVARTGPITVRAGWARFYLSTHASLMRFEYRIEMTMDEDASPSDSCVLKDRHWYIKMYHNQTQEEVHGSGVVGQHPVMKPGASYSWVSRTFFPPPGGSMRGHFTMCYLNRPHVTTEVECPEYIMMENKPS